ncbi:amidohydrolase [Roseateles chitinivorans]|uniref:Amidohydrolase n=1 Tax=Roseateles chitinivorans TaxID=2917965 RepID=A0A2G9C952_9BURK|nr:amidohydrolase [Roseateles chitinivorans]PIM52936.1 amidohydrolase [Roseateles chitinivorans]
MRRDRRVLLLGAGAAACLPSVLRAQSTAPAVVPPIAFIDVHLVPMDQERVLRHMTVLVRDGRIEAIGPELPVPTDAWRVEGQGRLWLSPGLADMHNHCDSRQDMAVLLSLGVTTMLNMGEARNSFVGRLRLAIERGEVPGPRAYVALAVDGSPAYGHLVLTSPEDARAAVRLARTNRYDFLKVYNGLSPEVFDTLVREGAAAGLPVVGHGVTRVGLARQIGAGQVLVAHAEEFFYTFFPPPREDDPDGAPPESAIADAVALLRRHGARVVADLVTYRKIAEQWGRPAVVDEYLRRPEAALVAPTQRALWPLAGYARRRGDLMRRYAFLEALVRAMQRAGVPLLSGTDVSDIPGLVPGYSLHENLALLTRAGLSRFDALSTATRQAGAFIAATRPGGAPFGTVTVGARADLLLSEANPLDDLTTLASPRGVLAAGRWHDEAALAALRRTVAETYRSAVAAAGPSARA